MMPPKIVPSRMAAKVPVSSRALPATSSSSARCWGRMAYFEGPKKADWAPSSSSTANSSQAFPHSQAAAPADMITISASLMRRISRDLSILSAIWPADVDSRKKGRMNRPAAALTSRSVFASSSWKTIHRVRLALKRLSFSAPRNCVANSGKRRRLRRSSNCPCSSRNVRLAVRVTNVGSNDGTLSRPLTRCTPQRSNVPTSCREKCELAQTSGPNGSALIAPAFKHN